MSIRFIQALCHVIDDGIADCAGPCDNQLHISENFTLLTSCGHAMCDDCKSFKRYTCLACHAAYQPHQMITGAQLQKFNKSSAMDFDGYNNSAIIDDDDNSLPDLDEGDRSKYLFGEKIDSCMQLIKGFGWDECVLLFVQFELIHNEVVKALDANSIKYIDLKNSKNKSQALVDYQSGKTQVLLLDIDDASASGR